MNKIKKSYITSLEIASVETVYGILDAKLDATNSESLVDYIGFSVGNIEDAISKMDKAMSDLKQMKINAKSQIEMIKEQSAKWLSDTGLDKLEGLIVSSITINNPAPIVDVKILDEDLITPKYFKKSVDKTAIKNALQNNKKVKGAELTTTHKQPTLKINKKRG